MIEGRTKRVLVAHNVKRHSQGGMARMLESIHAELNAFGWETEYFTSDDMPADASPRVRRYSFTWYVRKHARSAFLRGYPYDIINIHEPSGSALVMGRFRLGQPAIVAMSHGVEQRYWELRLRNSTDFDGPKLKERMMFPLTSLWQSRLTLCRADHVLCLNQEDKKFLQARFRNGSDNVTQVYPGAGSEFSRVAPERVFDRPVRKVLFSGTWIKRKGIHHLVQAFCILAASHPSIELGILGSGLGEEQVLDGFPSHIRARVTVYPSLSHRDCAQVLLDHDLFLLPSLFEGTPLALLEAMCTAIPVITTATCGMKDVVTDGYNGLLVVPGNAEQIVAAVEKLMGDANLRERLGRQAYLDASRKFTWKVAAEVVNAVYLQLLKSKP